MQHKPIRHYHIQTRGYSQENDYRWFLVESNGQIKPNVPLFLSSIQGFNVQDLVDLQRPSLVLFRDNKYLFLLATALEAEPSRVDYMGRPIRNSIAWTFEVGAESPENEKIIRAITIAALKGELASLISKSVQGDDNPDYGFKVSFEDLESVGKTFEILDNNSPNPNRLISGDSQKVRQELCNELSKSRLKDVDGLLILVTTLKSEEAMRALPVWRGISSRFSSDGQWLDISSLPPIDSSQKKRIPTFLILIIVLLGILLSLGIYLLGVKGVHLEKEPQKQEQKVEKTQLISPSAMETIVEEETQQ